MMGVRLSPSFTCHSTLCIIRGQLILSLRLESRYDRAGGGDPDVRAIQLAEDLIEKWNTCNDSLEMKKITGKQQ